MRNLHRADCSTRAPELLSIYTQMAVCRPADDYGTRCDFLIHLMGTESMVMANEEQMKAETLTSLDWARGLGFGLLAGAAFVAVALLAENEIIKAGAGRLFSVNRTK